MRIVLPPASIASSSLLLRGGGEGGVEREELGKGGGRWRTRRMWGEEWEGGGREEMREGRGRWRARRKRGRKMGKEEEEGRRGMKREGE